MVVVLPTERSVPNRALDMKSILLFGHPKIGKSTFANRAKKAVFFECEPGLNELSVFRIPIRCWPDFLEACKLIAEGNHDFRTIVIDTADIAFRLCTEYVNAKHGVEYEGDLPHGKGWAFVKAEWTRVLTRLAGLPYGLILISHATEKETESRTGTYMRTVPSLPERARQVVLGLTDLILFCDTVSVREKDGSVTTQRVIRTKPHPAWEAGDRTGRLPETMPLDYDAFEKAFTSDAL